MAATRPAAVASSASAMPGATTARLVFCEMAICSKACLMPQTVPNSPMKADGGEEGQAGVQPLALLVDGDAHRAVDARLRPGDQPAVLTVAAAPFQHAGGKDLLRCAFRLRPDLLEQFVEGVARPEGPVEDAGFALGHAEQDVLLDDDRPRPEGHDHQRDHHGLHCQGSAREKGKHGEINLLRHRKGFRFHMPALAGAVLSAVLTDDSIRF